MSETTAGQTASKPNVKKPKAPKELGPLTSFDAPRLLSTIRFSACGEFLFGVGNDAKVFRWKVTRPEPKSDYSFSDWPPLEGHHGWVTGLGLSATGERLFSADSWGKLMCHAYSDEQVEPLWSIEQAHTGWVRQIAVSPDSKKVASCGVDGRVILWSAIDGTLLNSWNDHPEDVYSVAFHPDGKSLVSGDIKGTIIHWDLESAKPIRRFEADVLYFADEDTLQDVGGVRRLIFDPAGRTLVACGGKPSGGGFVKSTPMAKFFDWTDGSAIETRAFGDEKAGFVHDAVYHADGYLIGTSSGLPGEGQIFLWRPGEDKPYFVYSKLLNTHSVSLHPDGVHVAFAGTNKKQASNGRNAATDKEYIGSYSPISFWDLTQFKG